MLAAEGSSEYLEDHVTVLTTLLQHHAQVNMRNNVRSSLVLICGFLNRLLTVSAFSVSLRKDRPR